MTRAWGGRAVTRARALVERRDLLTPTPVPCGQCGEPITPGAQEWVVGHIKSRVTYPELAWDPSNWRPEHRACSDRSAQAAVIERAKADALRDAGLDPRVSSRARASSEEPHLPFSLPSTLHRPRITHESKSAPSTASREPLHLRPALEWNPDRMRQYPWLAEFADVPEDASPPLAMTPPDPDAVCSYGWSGCTHVEAGHQIADWADAQHRISLRWWQRLAIVRQHEHRADGSLIWKEIVESAPRRAGKSVRIRAVATWRLDHGDFIGEPQTVVHCGNDLPICREIQRGAWRWAETRWGRDSVMKGNGKESIENPNDGSRWIVKAQDAAYGYDANLAAVDEAWDVKPETVTEGLEPMLLERLWAQLHITSTSHRRARSTLKAKIASLLASDDGRGLLLLWGARPQDDPADPATWRKASPHWTEDRRQMIASKYEQALAGEDDPQADDPDPMEGFRAQYLNVWTLSKVVVARGDALVDKAAWDQLTIPTRTDVPEAVAIESWFDAGATVALAWQLPDGAAAVHTLDVDDIGAAVAAVTATGYAGKILAGKSLVTDPAFTGLAVDAMSGRTIGAVLDLGRLLAEGLLAHTGSTGLRRQILAARTVEGSDGLRLASTGRADAVKAAAWAASAARARPRRARRPRVLTSTK